MERAREKKSKEIGGRERERHWRETDTERQSTRQRKILGKREREKKERMKEAERERY